MPVELGDRDLDKVDGIEAKIVVVEQLEAALEVIRQHQPARIVTLGGECSVSVAPFSQLAARYGDELAVLWVDSHPDVGTPASTYPGYHAMAVAALTGHGDPDVLALLPATGAPERVALVGVHAWDEDDFAKVAKWGIRSLRPNDLRHSSQPLLDWLAGTAVPGWRSTSMSTPSTATRSCWVWAPSRTDCAAPRSAGSLPTPLLPRMSWALPWPSTFRGRSCACSRSCRGCHS